MASGTGIWDIDSIGLTNVVAGLNRGVDPGGAAIGAPTPFVTGVAALVVGAILGALIGLFTALFVHFRPSTYQFTSVIGIAMVTVIGFSALVGAFLPVFFKRIGVDPAIATAPIISMFCDIMGIIIYLSLASYLLIT